MLCEICARQIGFAVPTGNFKAVDYYLSVLITEEYVQVQVVNVSTGEYEGNVTVNL